MRAAARPFRQVAAYQIRGPWRRRDMRDGCNGHRKHEFRIPHSHLQGRVFVRSTTSVAVADATWEGSDVQETRFVDALLEQHANLEEGTDEVNAPVALDPRHEGAVPPAAWVDQPQSSLVAYGKWRRLATQYLKLKQESDISGKIGSPKLVDDPANINDVELWNLILNFRYRLHGYDGVIAVLDALRSRKVLWEVEGPAAASFWNTILIEAVRQEEALLAVWEYAEWLYEAHGVRWPKLHETVLTAFVKRRISPQQAVQWHIRLSPNYPLSAPAFAELLQRFIADPDPVVQDILAGLYKTSTHRQLYDELVPQLYSQGHLTLARTWRYRLTTHGDHPSSFASRPFLRFMAGYFPRVSMVPMETLAAGVNSASREREDQLAQIEGVGTYRQLINRIHGRTFGIKEKTYNDTLGARWFASSWISVDLALDVVRFLGLDSIGPLSLQSIALREGNADRVLDRIDQLELSGISIGDSSYAKAIRHFASMDDDETLSDLLYSDLHPDVFEDIGMQKEVLRMAMRTGNWAPYRLVLSVKLAVALDSLALVSNQLAVESLVTGDTQMTMRMLGDMHKRAVQILPSTSDAISLHLISRLRRTQRPTPPLLDHYVALSRLVMASRFPLATEALNALLNQLGHQGRLEEMERMSMEILQRYSAVRNSARATLNVHRLDVPDLLNEEPNYGSFELIPRELNLRHDKHPIQRIFDRELQHSIIHWGFQAPHVSQPLPNSAKNPRQPIDFSFARGIRLLAILRDNGVLFDVAHINRIRDDVELHLATILGDPGKSSSSQARFISQLGLEEAKNLCDLAWGGELLSPLRKLKGYVASVAEKLEVQAGEARERIKSGPKIRMMKQSTPLSGSMKKFLQKRQ